jgi:hypothetical protein
MSEALTQAEPAGLRAEYNHDLNVSEEFLAAYPSIRKALKDERLLERFTFFEDRAKSHKRWFHLLGLWSLILGSVPLIIAALRMIVGEGAFAAYTRAYSAAELCGVASICLVLWNRLKRHRMLWCQAVFYRERLRQWHFQKFLDGPLIEKLVGNEAEYDAELNRRRVQLEQNFHDGYGTMMEFTRFASRENNFLHEPANYSDSRIARTVFDALRTLRFEHQLRFSQRKIEPEAEHASLALKERATVSETIASVTLAGAVLISALSVFVSGAHEFDLPLQWDQLLITRCLGGTALLLAVVSAASRAYRSGFTLPDESESYEEYCGRIRELKPVFLKTALSDEEKLRQLEQLEEEAAAELRRFMRMKTRATFLF